MRTLFLPDAGEEFLEAARFYDSEAPGVGMAFIVEIHKAISILVIQPLSAPEARNNIRKKTIKHFPYSLFYSVESDVIVIVAVAHHKRRPSYWHKKVRSPRRQP